MSTKKLSNLYDHLDPGERFALILSAVMRNDPVEAKRLQKSAKSARWASDYQNRLDGFHNAFMVHVTCCLDDIVRLIRLDNTASSMVRAPLPNQAEVEWFVSAAAAQALMLVYRCEAWRRFCEERGIDSEAYLALSPASKTINETLAVAKEVACTVEEADAWVQKERGPEAKARRMEYFLAELEAIHQAFVEQ